MVTFINLSLDRNGCRKDKKPGRSAPGGNPAPVPAATRPGHTGRPCLCGTDNRIAEGAVFSCGPPMVYFLPGPFTLIATLSGPLSHHVRIVLLHLPEIKCTGDEQHKNHPDRDQDHRARHRCPEERPAETFDNAGHRVQAVQEPY